MESAEQTVVKMKVLVLLESKKALGIPSAYNQNLV